MGQRSRKRQRTSRPDPAAAPQQSGASAKPPAAPQESAPPGRDRMRAGYARGRERDERIRAALEPLQPGERPAPLVVAAVVAFALGAANLALMIAGVEVRGDEPPAFGVLLFAALMFAAAYGVWRARYWAILGFQAILTLTILVAGLSLTVASDAFAVLLCLGIVLFGGWLFWKLIRVMARVQMPERGR